MKNFWRSFFQSRKSCLLMLIGIFIVSRCIYWRMGVRFEAGTLGTFWQIIDPVLLRDELWRSLFYLRGQPPALNLGIGLTMHIFPRHWLAAFSPGASGLGLVLAISMFLLLDRLRLSRPLALLVTTICVISPVTVLYENWLFYEYPLAVLFCVSALFLNRYASNRNSLDGVAFFTSLALIGMFRVVYSLMWFLIIAALVIYALPKARRKTILSAAVPGLLLLTVYLKSLILFGLWIPGGDAYGGFNLASVASANLPRDVFAGMVAAKKVSPIMLHPFEDEELVRIVPLPPRAGIRILDERVKSTGTINMDSLWMGEVGKQLHKDGLVVLRSHPGAALTMIRRNLVRYYLPADIGWPFYTGMQSNLKVLQPFLTVFDLITAGKHPAHRHSFISYVTISCLLWFGLRRSARWLKRALRRPNGNARDVTIIFAFGNIAYLSAVVLLYAQSQQNRILFEVFPLFTILLGSMIVFVTRRIPAASASAIPQRTLNGQYDLA